MTTDADKLHAKKQRGEHAAELLAHPLLVEAFDSVRETCVAKFESDDLDPEQLVRVWLVYRLYLKLEAHLKKVVREGRDASRFLEEAEKTKTVNGQA